MTRQRAVRAVTLAPMLAAVVLAAPASAQDAHYWTYGYGPVGQLTEKSTARTVVQVLAVEGQQAALLAVASGSTIDHLPLAWLGSTMIGRWLSSLTAGIKLTSSVLRV